MIEKTRESKMMQQMSIFDGAQLFKIDKPIRLITLFSGYDSQALALKYLDVPFEHYRTCEWAISSIQALHDLHFADDKTDYSAGMNKAKLVEVLAKYGISADYNQPLTAEKIRRYGEDKLRTIYNNIKSAHNMVSIVNAKGKDLGIVDTEKYCYIMTYSFPCQDLSNAGLQKGMGKGSGTRSGLLWEVERLLKESKELPQVLLMENVPQVIGKKNIGAFAEWIAFLDSLGYHSKWEVINATEYAVPQNRQRCFMVSVLGDHFYNFPKKIGNTRKLRDILENNVPENYYLSEKILQYFINHTKECQEKGQGFKFEPSNGERIARTVTTRAGNRINDNFVAFYGIDCKQTSEEWILPPLKEKARCIRTTGGGAVIEQTKRCICVGMLGGKYETLHDQTRRVYDIGGCAPTQHTVGGGNLETKITDSDCKVRKLTERECFRLMGVKDEDFDKISSNQSKSKLYHLAGDSIVTTCLMAIFGQILDIDWEEKIREVMK